MTGDGIAPGEIAAEQRHVDRVYARLEVLKREAGAAERSGYRLATAGVPAALVDRDAMVHHVARRRRLLDSEHEGLVFGRLDLRDEGEPRHIGRIGLRDADGTCLVVDWRAPAAAPYYRATPVDPLGVIRRRTITTAGEKVTGVDDDLLDPRSAPPDLPVIGDGALVAALARATGPGMRDIVATIGREQDEAIRSPALGVTLVRGGPGTGKTAVALHRAAYLLYSDRQRFAGGGVLVVGPSAGFVGYISRVLPSLGEDEVTLQSLGEIVPGIRATRHDRDPVAAVKGSLRMAQVLARAVRDSPAGAPDTFRLLYRGTLLRLSAADLRRLRSAALGRGRHNAVRPKAAGLVLDALWRQAVAVLGRTATPERVDFAGDVAGRREFTAFMRAWWPRLRPDGVLAALSDPARAARHTAGILSTAERDLLVGSLREERGTPSVEDVALLDELAEVLGTPPEPARRPVDPYLVAPGVREVTTHADRVAAARAAAVARPEDYRDYAHVVVDEAQDVSPMQWRMLGRRAQYASWTVVGDPAQAAWHGDAAETRRARDAALGHRRRHEYTLRTNYRNAAEVFDVAARVIRREDPRADLPVAVRHTGIAPRHLVVRDVAAAVPAAAADLLSDVDGAVGVVTTLADRDRVAGWLAGTAPGRLSVMDGLDAKGMEYDGVLVVRPSAIAAESPSGPRTLYVALSRATTRLTTVDTIGDWF